jgi:hypothetical protein
MRVLILLANLCVLILPAKVCVLFLLANLCTPFASKVVLANVCVLIVYTTHGRVCLSTHILVYTDHPFFCLGVGMVPMGWPSMGQVTYIHMTKSRQDICMGATRQRSISSQWSCPKRWGVWTSSCVYIHGFTEPMRVLILLANLCVLIYTYNQVQTGHLHGCHSTEEHFITMELSQEVWCVDFVMCIYTWVHRTHG